MSRLQFYIIGLLSLGVVAFSIGGCSRLGPSPAPDGNPPPSLGPSPSVESTAIPTQPPPSATPPPLALRVNGFTVTLAEYQAEAAQFKAVAGSAELTPDQEQTILNDLTDQALLAQAAQEAGFIFDENQILQRAGELAAQLGGEAALQDWIQANGFNADSFLLALQRQQASAWMRDKILAETPHSAEQVHARQILLYNADEAADVLAQLKAGNDFGNLAVTYDPITRGDLGWFPRGYLTDPKLDDVLFNLQPEQYSDVIETAAGFHILQLLERADQRPLSPEALLLVQTGAIQAWLEARRSQAQIEILLP